jgi:uncharacterized protein YkwD
MTNNKVNNRAIMMVSNTPKKILLAISFLWLILLTGCQPEEAGPKAEAGANINKTRLLQLVNNQRTKGCNCGSDYYAPTTAVTWSNVLELVAYDHSSDMNRNSFFSHTGNDGSDPGDRMTRRNYNWRTYGENIAKGYGTEESVINAWIESPGHCRNIMNPGFKEMGISKVSDYWTQVFGTLR